MSVHSKPAPAATGRRSFTLSTELMQGYGIETPVSGATQIVTASSGGRFRDVVSIGSDGHLYLLARDAAERWTRTRLPWTASALAAVAQRDGTDRVFFAELDSRRDERGRDEKTVTVYELEHRSGESRRRSHGRFVTSDARVYGITALRGLQCRDGSSLLATTLAAHPPCQSSSWLVLFGHGSSTGALSLAESRGVVASHVALAEGDPGATRWPHVTILLRDGDRLRLEWGALSGALLQTERLPIPELAGVIDADVVRDHTGRFRIFALGRVNGLAYAISPLEPVVAETDALGKLSVVFELAEESAVPSLSFESELFEGGFLDVCPQRKAHLFVQETRARLLRPGSRARMYLIPEDTPIEPS